MASSNFSKIIRKNGVVKPWLVKKATAQILSQYFGSNAPSWATAVQERAAKFNNEGPVRTWKANTARFHCPIAVKQGATNKTNNFIAPTIRGIVGGPGFATNGTKKLLKLPTLKLNTARKYGSSARVSERNMSHTSALGKSKNFQRMFGPVDFLQKIMTNNRKPSYTTLMEPVRNQHMTSYLGSIPDAVAYSNLISKELMDVSSDVKKRIAVQGPKKDTREIFQTKTPDQPVFVQYKYPIMQEHSRLNERIIAAAGIYNQVRQLRKLSCVPFNKERKLASSFIAPSNSSLRKSNRAIPRRITPKFGGTYKETTAPVLWGHLKPNTTEYKKSPTPAYLYEAPTSSQTKAPRRKWPRGCEPEEETRQEETNQDKIRPKAPAPTITDPAEDRSIMNLDLMSPLKTKNSSLFQYPPPSYSGETKANLLPAANRHSRAAAASRVQPKPSALWSYTAEAPPKSTAPIKTQGIKKVVKVQSSTKANSRMGASLSPSKQTIKQKPKPRNQAPSVSARHIIKTGLKQPNVAHASQLSSRLLLTKPVSTTQKAKTLPPKVAALTNPTIRNMPVKSTAPVETKTPESKPTKSSANQPKAAAQRMPTVPSAQVPKARPQPMPIKSVVPKKSTQEVPAKPLIHVHKEITHPIQPKPKTKNNEPTQNKSFVEAAKENAKIKRNHVHRETEKWKQPQGAVTAPNKPIIAKTTGDPVVLAQPVTTAAISNPIPKPKPKETERATKFNPDEQHQSRILAILARQGKSTALTKARKDRVLSMAPPVPTATATALQHGRPISKYSAPRYSHMGFIKRKTNY